MRQIMPKGRTPPPPGSAIPIALGLLPPDDPVAVYTVALHCFVGFVPGEGAESLVGVSVAVEGGGGALPIHSGWGRLGRPPPLATAHLLKWRVPYALLFAVCVTVALGVCTCAGCVCCGFVRAGRGLCG